jgi:hypothetical protein
MIKPVASMLAMALLVAAPAAAQRAAAPASPEARVAVAKFAQCIVRTSPAKVHDVLTQDFRTRAYGQALRVLSDNNRDCYRTRATMRAGGLALAAALAEAMIKADPRPLRSRLAAAAVGKTAPTYAPSDAVAMCVARSAPDEVTALLSAPIASPEEVAAAAKLGLAVNLCSRQQATNITGYGLRAILATATYRLLAAQGTAG